MPPKSTKPQVEYVELIARVLSIPIQRPSQFNEGKQWVIINTDKGKLSGEIEPGSVLTQCDYRLSGYWEENQYGKTFKFKSYAIREPSSRHGVVQYLSKFCSWIGAVTANRLCDQFGVDTCIARLRESPEEVAATGILNLERCQRASEELKKIQAFEDTRVKLLDIFAGRGFRSALPDLLIEKYKSEAAKIVRENPFILVEEKFPGCGFSIVDQLYIALGHDPAAMKRQVYALCYVLENLADNSTWGSRSNVYTEVGKLCSKGLQFQDCINEAVKLNKIRTRTHGPMDELFLAVKAYADQESMIAERLWEIGGAGLLGDAEKSENVYQSAIQNQKSDGIVYQSAIQNDSNSGEDLLSDWNHDQSIDFNAIKKSPLTYQPNPVCVKRQDIRDVIQPIPAKHQSPMQDDDLTFDLDATIEPDESYDDAQELVEELDSLLEQIQDIDAAVNYFDNCTESLAGISENIERKKTATDKQLNALRNMISGCERWIEGNERGRDRW